MSAEVLLAWQHWIKAVGASPVMGTKLPGVHLATITRSWGEIDYLKKKFYLLAAFENKYISLDMLTILKIHFLLVYVLLGYVMDVIPLDGDTRWFQRTGKKRM